MTFKLSLSPAGWLKLVAFEIIGGALALLLALVLCRILPFKTPEIALAARPYAVGTLIALWYTVSLVAAFEYRFGVDGQARFALSAAIGIAPAATSFSLLFAHRYEGLGHAYLIGLTLCLVAACGGLSLYLSEALVRFSMAAGDRFAPLFDRIFFEPS
jgi:hypothetical protein